MAYHSTEAVGQGEATEIVRSSSPTAPMATTLESLFARLDNKLDGLNQRLSSTDNKLDGLTRQQSDMNRQQHDMNSRLSSSDEKLDGITRQQSQTDRTISNLVDQQDEVLDRLELVEDSLHGTGSLGQRSNPGWESHHPVVDHNPTAAQPQRPSSQWENMEDDAELEARARPST